MWEYQPHFRGAFRNAGRIVLDALEPALRPDVLLVGVRRWGKRHPVTIQPESGPWDLELFRGLHVDLDRRLRAERGRPRHRRGFEERDLSARVLRDVVQARVSSVDEEQHTRSFCGPPTVVGEYEVVPCIVVEAEPHEQLERLDLPAVLCDTELHVAANLVDAAIQELLLDASFSLLIPDAGHYTGELFRRSREEVLREAARTLTWTAVVATVRRPDAGEELFEAVNAVSAITYESLEALGQIAIAPPTHPDVSVHVRLARPVPMRSTGWVRKLLETTRTGALALLTDGEQVYGLGTAKPGIPRIDILGEQQWQLYQDSRVLLQVDHGSPGLPQPRLDRLSFEDNLRRILRGVDDRDAHVLWELVEAVIDQRHGALLVVSADAVEEAERLSGQSMPIEPRRPSPEELRAITTMDGAVLLDQHGQVHAAGAILDGMATRHGDPGRGSRYNSAVRYVASRPDDSCIAIVVSKDGGVDVVPSLPPRIDRREVRERVETLDREAQHLPERRRVNEAVRWLDAHRDYVSAREAQRANVAIAAIGRKLGPRLSVPPRFEGPDQVDPRLFGEEETGE